MYAHAGVGVGVEPAVTEVTVRPEGVTRGILTIVNNESDYVSVIIETRDYLKERTGAGVLQVEDWLTITPEEFDMEPYATEELEYVIEAPSGYEGELAAMLFFTANLPGEDGPKTAGKTGVAVYAAVEGTIKLDCGIQSVRVKRDIVKNPEGAGINRGIMFILEVENKGNVHLRPEGNIVIAGEDGSEYDVGIKKGFPLYPGSSLSYAVKWDEKDLSPGAYDVYIVLDYGNIYDEYKIAEKEARFSVDEEGNISR